MELENLLKSMGLVDAFAVVAPIDEDTTPVCNPSCTDGCAEGCYGSCRPGATYAY